MGVAIFSFKSIFISLVCVIFIKIILSILDKSKSKKLPPSPPSLPLIGHLYLLKTPLHQTLARVAERYGPAVFLYFGSRPVLVISSYSLAKQCFTTHDMAFSNRVHLPSGKHVTFDYDDIGAANYGPHWRNVRQVAATELLSPQRLHATSDIRVGEVHDLARRLFQSWNAASTKSMGPNYFQKVELKSKLFELSLNILMTMIAGKRFYGDNIDDMEETKRFREAVEGFLALSGAANVEDFLPILRLLGVTGAAKKMKHLADLNEEMTQKLIDEHRKETGEKKTMIAKLLELQKENPEKYNYRNIQIIAVSLLQAGTDTSSNSAEWAMTLLLNNPDVLKKATQEINEYVGNERVVQESDMPNLPYLHSILQEVFRLYPGGPLLVPHESREQVTIGSYDIPSGTMLLVNAYHIQRDPSLWDEPTKFKPERFEGEIKPKWMIPFGMGRRRCPGEALAVRKVGLTIGTLIQCFDWKRVGDELVDMTEGPGLTLPKAVPLEALYRPRPVMMKVLSNL